MMNRGVMSVMHWSMVDWSMVDRSMMDRSMMHWSVVSVMDRVRRLVPWVIFPVFVVLKIELDNISDQVVFDNVSYKLIFYYVAYKVHVDFGLFLFIIV